MMRTQFQMQMYSKIFMARHKMVLHVNNNTQEKKDKEIHSNHEIVYCSMGKVKGIDILQLRIVSLHLIILIYFIKNNIQ